MSVLRQAYRKDATSKRCLSIILALYIVRNNAPVLFYVGIKLVAPKISLGTRPKSLSEPSQRQ